MNQASQKGDMNLSLYITTENEYLTQPMQQSYLILILPREQNGYSVILFLGHLSMATVIKNFVLQYFLPTNKDKISTTIKDLKNKKIKWAE
jgi:hypothetical protein